MITATRLTARGVFENLDFHAPTGALLVVEGVHRSGKTALLLAIARRFPITGTLISAPRKRVALAEQATVNALDEALTVEQHLAQAALLARPWWQPFVRRATVQAIAATVLPRDLPLGVRIGDLTPVERFACGVGLALVAHPEILIVDDVDSLRDSDDRVAAWNLLLALPAELTVVASCQDAAELPAPTDLPVPARPIVVVALSS